MDTGPALTLDQLRNGVQAERFDTVLLAYGDAHGRLAGKRIVAEHFLDTVVERGSEVVGDHELVPDFSTMRPIPWHEKTALCLGDLRWTGGAPVAGSPRQVLLAQLERLSARGLEAIAGADLEFQVFAPGFEDAAEKGYRELKTLPPTSAEKLLGRLRRELTTAGVEIESTDDGSVSFRSGPALKTADDHVIFKHAAREVAALEEHTIAFMAAYAAGAGASCHIRFSLFDGEGSVFARDPGFFERWTAGQLACLRELTLLFAPGVNSYKRFASFTASAVRVAGEGDALRMELCVPGADVNPYLALAAIIAAGLHGLDSELAPSADDPRLPSSLAEACLLFETSKVAVSAFGEEVVEHSLKAARDELEAFQSAITDWERVREFERP
jgi:glutamine synthetase